VANSDEQLLSVLAKLEECRVALVAEGNLESAQLVAVAILDIRMKLNSVNDDELRALCDEMLPGERKTAAQRRRPLLRVVK